MYQTDGMTNVGRLRETGYELKHTVACPNLIFGHGHIWLPVDLLLVFMDDMTADRSRRIIFIKKIS